MKIYITPSGNFLCEPCNESADLPCTPENELPLTDKDTGLSNDGNYCCNCGVSYDGIQREGYTVYGDFVFTDMNKERFKC